MISIQATEKYSTAMYYLLMNSKPIIIAITITIGTQRFPMIWSTPANPAWTEVQVTPISREFRIGEYRLLNKSKTKVVLDVGLLDVDGQHPGGGGGDGEAGDLLHEHLC